MQKLPSVVFGVGLTTLVSAVVFGWMLFPQFLNYQISKNVKLVNGSETWENWSDIPVPVFISFYVFNVTNPDAIKNGGLPVLKEIGPFVYREKRKKVDISQENDETVTYRQPVFYYFEPEKSGNLTENDVLTILNVPFVAMSEMVSHMPFYLKFMANVYLMRFKEKLFIQRPVREILFDGWRLPMVDEIQKMSKQEVMPNATFGFFYGKNGTDEGEFQISTGVNSPSTFGEIITWNGKTNLGFWPNGTHCDQIKGTDGSIFPPFVNKSRILELYSPDLCRSLYLTYEKEINFHGISGLRFNAPLSLLESPQTSEENRCYCIEDDINNCLKDSALLLSACREGVPVAMSTPHFLNGYEPYWKDTGLTPSAEKHETFIDIEPLSGVVLRAHKRIQINMLLKRIKSVPEMSDLKEILFPVLWADETAEMDAKNIKLIKTRLTYPIQFVQIGKWIGAALGCILIASAIVIYVSRARRNKQQYSY